MRGLFEPGKLNLVLTDLDRLVVGGVMPVEPLALPACPEFGTLCFTERRELGIVNLAHQGNVRVGGQVYSLGYMDFLYIGTGNPDVVFESCGSVPACFYLLSAPAHRQYLVARLSRADVPSEAMGEAKNASRRHLHRCIHDGGIQSCQLVMGFTELEEASVWNTMPTHTHSRRSEVYLYTGLGEGMVLHLMGEPAATRHLIVRDREAVLSPSWSIHTGVGTNPYSFIWGMAGENKSYSDIDPVSLNDLA